MPDRLAELRHQRALVQQHLEWLDREIAAAAASSSAPAANRVDSPAPLAVAPAPALLASAAGAPPTPIVRAPDPDTILAQYRSEPTSLRNDVRKGCLLYFAAAFVLLGLGVTAMYYLLRSR